MAGLMERLAEGRALVLDGATGTYLQGRGLEIGEAPEAWTLSHPDVVKGMAAAYFSAGSDAVETNTFGGTRFRLKAAGLEGRVREVNRRAAELAREAAPGGRMVLGSIGPTGEFLAPLGLLEPDDAYEAFAEQAAALAEAGVDAFCVETMTALEEAVVAVRAVREAGRRPVIATMTFDEGPKGFATSMGVSIPQAVSGLVGAGVDVVGTNCGNGIEQMIRIVREVRSCTDLPILAQPNAGLPVMEDGEVVYPDSPEKMVGLYMDMIAAGATIIGGCCGTGPEHIAALVRRLAEKG